MANAVNTAEETVQTANFDDVAETFEEMGLKPELLRGIYDCG